MKKNYFYGFFLLVAISITLLCCKKEDNSILSTVETYNPLYISSTAATVGCWVKSDGGSGIVDCGIYISDAPNPETSSTKLKIGSDTGLFLGQVTGFLPNVKYYIKAYAVNTKGESLGEQLDFTTPAQIRDFDNNLYKTVKIVNQTWLAENLKTTRYRNGDLIGTTALPATNISGENAPKYQWAYEGDESNMTAYGLLYTWYAATDSRGLCPTGWHLPTDAEWHTLALSLDAEAQIIDGMESITAGGKLREAGTSHWTSPNTGANNISLFSALPGGYRYYDGKYNDIKNSAIFCSSTENNSDDIWNRYLFFSAANLNRAPDYKNNGYSVRCIKD
jgi:uncharacterized protein (TIGR02145 family)